MINNLSTMKVLPYYARDRITCTRTAVHVHVHVRRQYFFITSLAFLVKLTHDMISELSSLNRRQLVLQILGLGLVITSALVIWRSLVYLANSESPMVVVLSGSMEPAFFRGDILFLNHSKRSISVGEVIVFNIEGRKIPIVHRVISSYSGKTLNNTNYLTKGDNNFGDDTVLYAAGQPTLSTDNIVGGVAAFIPCIGRITIIMNDFPILKYSVIGILCFLVVLSRD